MLAALFCDNNMCYSIGPVFRQQFENFAVKAFEQATLHALAGCTSPQLPVDLLYHPIRKCKNGLIEYSKLYTYTYTYTRL